MEEGKINSYRDLVVWQRAMELVVVIYELTDEFPHNEQYGLVSQMRRAAVSIPSNIAEGSRRSSKKDFKHFLLTAFGSGSELETQIEIVKRLSFGTNLNFEKIDSLLVEVMKMLNGLIGSLHDNE
ncbi:MAG: four helix bundle protein [Candidatus Jorgensenbacteria bacterium]